MTLDLVEVVQALHDLPEFVREKARVVVLKNAELMQGLAQYIVRVDTGRLRDSIQIVDKGDTILVVAGGPQAPYAPIIEAKFPFLQPAVNAVLPQLEDQLRAIQKEIDNFVR